MIWREIGKDILAIILALIIIILSLPLVFIKVIWIRGNILATNLDRWITNILEKKK